MVAKEKTPKTAKARKASKAKTPKPVKPQKVTILDTELDRLKLAEKTLEELIEAKRATDLAEIELETAKDQAKARKGAYDTARLKVDEIIEAWSRPLPLFDKPKPPTQKPEAKPLNPDAPKVKIIDKACGLPVGAELAIFEVCSAGVRVMDNCGKVDVLEAEYEATADVQILIAEARAAGIMGAGSAEAWSKFLADKQPTPTASKVAWMILPLSAAGINGKAGTALEEAGIGTLGELVAKMQRGGTRWFEDVKNVGQELAGELADKIGFYQMSHPDFDFQAAA